MQITNNKNNSEKQAEFISLFKRTTLCGIVGIFLMTETSEARWHPILMKTPIGVFEQLGIDRANIISGASLIFKAGAHDRIKEIIGNKRIPDIERQIGTAVDNIKAAGQKLRQVKDSDQFWTHTAWDAILLYRERYMGPETAGEHPESIAKAYAEKRKKSTAEPQWQDFVSCHKKKICIDLAKSSGDLEVLRKISKTILDTGSQTKIQIDDNFELLKNLYLAKLYALCFHDALGTITMVTSNTEQICQKIVSNKQNSIHELACIIRFVQKGTECKIHVLSGLFDCVKNAIKYGVGKDEILSILLAIAFEFADTHLDLIQLIRSLALEACVTDLKIESCESFENAFLREEYDIYSEAFGIPYETAKDLYPASYRPAANSVIPITAVTKDERIKAATRQDQKPGQITRYSDCFESTIMHLLISALSIPTDTNTRLCESSSFHRIVRDFLHEHPNYYSFPFSNDIAMRADWAIKLYSITPKTPDADTYVLDANGTKLELNANLKNLALVLCQIAQIDPKETINKNPVSAIASSLNKLFGKLEGVRKVTVGLKKSKLTDMFCTPCYMFRINVYRRDLTTTIDLRIIENRHAEVESIAYTRHH
ncbi:hypothetical protein FACS189472_13980 [Alphaproteobacteria bacterium]|nr:hypothetical protein FACS189472_13980 [Alphaproteobacteria bacterium]